MTRIALLAAGCAALALAACDHPDAKRQQAARAMKVVSRLDCPAEQGVLKRVSAAADGQTCAYAGDGADVVLTLVKLNGEAPSVALDPIEAQLKALMPASEAATTAAAAGDKGEEVDIRLPGLSIQANNAGAVVNVAGAKIDANDDGAQVRVERNVRVGDKTIERESRRRRVKDDGVMARYILASEAGDSPWSVVGYEARGPKGGPLVVGTVKVKSGAHADDDVFRDVGKLIRHTVGGRTRGVSMTVD